MILARPWRLLGLFMLFAAAPLALGPLWIPDEARYAEMAREMLESGNWVVPRLLGLDYFEKPVAALWTTALSQSLFGQNLFASRLPVALSTALSALMVGWLAQRMWHDNRKTQIAMLVYLSSALVMGGAVYITLDPQFACWFNLELLAFHAATTLPDSRRRLGAWALLGAACGMAFLTKGFLGWLLPVLVAVPYMTWQHRLRELLRHGPLAVLVALAIAAPWSLLVHRRAPDFWNFFFWNEHIRRFAAANAQHGEPFWFYLPVLLLGCVPWLGLLPQTVRRAWADKGDPDIGLLLIAIVLPLAFFSVSHGKLPAYILPCFMPLALLFAHALVQQLDARRPGAFKANAGINAAIGAIGIAALVAARQKAIYAPEDRMAWLVAAGIAAAWLVVALAQWRWPLRCWELSALPLWLSFACLPWLLTQAQINSKQPSAFIRANIDCLRAADMVVSNDVGLAANLAWELKRTDIVLYSTAGELAYGVATPAGAARFVGRTDIAGWIASARRRGNVAVVLRTTGFDAESRALRALGGERDLRNRFALFFYPKVAP